MSRETSTALERLQNQVTAAKALDRKLGEFIQALKDGNDKDTPAIKNTIELLFMTRTYVTYSALVAESLWTDFYQAEAVNPTTKPEPLSREELIQQVEAAGLEVLPSDEALGLSDPDSPETTRIQVSATPTEDLRAMVDLILKQPNMAAAKELLRTRGVVAPPPTEENFDEEALQNFIAGKPKIIPAGRPGRAGREGYDPPPDGTNPSPIFFKDLKGITHRK